MIKMSPIMGMVHGRIGGAVLAGAKHPSINLFQFMPAGQEFYENQIASAWSGMGCCIH